MPLAYSSLFIVAFLALLPTKRKTLHIGILITLLLGLYDKVINLESILFISLFSFLTYLYFNHPFFKNYKKASFIGILIFLLAFQFHLVPGFSNLLAINQIKLSCSSVPFSMYLNFDKVMSALIFYVFSDLPAREKKLNFKHFKTVSILLVLCIIVILAPALAIGYIKYDPKIPNILFIWIINNFFFVCLAEEVVYRGFVQEKLKEFLNPYTKVIYLPIIIASFLFGFDLNHLRGGLIFAGLAAVCGCFYGLTYYKTNRLICSMLVHFGLNLCHFILFTYPSAAPSIFLAK